jgi:hypothetical protein
MSEAAKSGMGRLEVDRKWAQEVKVGTGCQKGVKDGADCQKSGRE